MHGRSHTQSTLMYESYISERNVHTWHPKKAHKRTHKHTYLIQHRSQNLSGHNETRGVGFDADVTRDQTHVAKRFFEIAKFLIGKGFDGRRVDGTCHVFGA